MVLAAAFEPFNFYTTHCINTPPKIQPFTIKLLFHHARAQTKPSNIILTTLYHNETLNFIVASGQDNAKGSGVWFGFYKFFLIVWISFGLGYLVMVMTFISRGLRSKKIAQIEHKLALKLKHTQSKIWQEFNEDVSYLRRVFNELQLSKVKVLYTRRLL